MKTLLSFALFALVASMIVAPAFADSKMDSFVNLATQARTQVKIQMDKLPSVSDEIKSLYIQGDSETEQLIASVKKGDSTGAKTHFLAAMKAFRQITQAFSEVTQAPEPVAPKIAAPVADFDYTSALKRYEINANILKASANKNNLQVDFSKFDNLLQTAKSNLASGDVATLEKTFGDLKAAGIELQTTIQNMVAKNSNTRAMSFAKSYITKIDAVLAQAKELGLSEDQITKLQNAKEELASGADTTQIIIKIKRVYQINLDLLEAKNQKILSDISRLESRLLLLEPKIDDTIRPKFDTAKTVLASLKDPTSETDSIKLLRTLESTIKEIEAYLLSLQTQPVSTQVEEEKTAPPPEKPTETRESFQLQDTQQAQTESLKVQEPKAEKQKQTKNQRQSAEISRLEAKLAELEPYVDENIKPKFDSAKSMLERLKESGNNYIKTIRAINSLIDEMSRYIESQESRDNSG